MIIVLSLENLEALHIENCNINLELNHKTPVEFHSLKNYYSHLIMQELGKFNLKVNVIPNGFIKVYELYHQ